MEMEPNPTHVNGYPVVLIARIAPDMSERQNLATVVVDTGKSVPARFVLWDIACNDGEVWNAENGVHDLIESRAGTRFNKRVQQRDKLRNLSRDRDTSWSHYALIRWSHVPVTGHDEFTVYARDVAGRARNFPEFYTPASRAIQWAIEQWLTQYSAAHTHPDLRK